jgi:hypothetical protein
VEEQADSLRVYIANLEAILTDHLEYSRRDFAQNRADRSRNPCSTDRSFDVCCETSANCASYRRLISAKMGEGQIVVC